MSDYATQSECGVWPAMQRDWAPRGVAPGAKVGNPTEGVGVWTVAMETDAKLTSWSEEGYKQHEGVGPGAWRFALPGVACEG